MELWVLYLCHWQIIHDLSSNSSCKLECSVFGANCQLIRTQIYWKNKCKMSFGYSLLYLELLLMQEVCTQSLAFAAQLYLLVLLPVNPAGKALGGKEAKETGLRGGGLKTPCGAAPNGNEDTWTTSRAISHVYLFLSPFLLADVKAEFWTVATETERERVRKSKKESQRPRLQSPEKYTQRLQSQQYRSFHTYILYWHITEINGPWPGGPAGQIAVPTHQGCRLAPCSGHTRDSANDYVSRWNKINVSIFLSLPVSL